MSNRIKEIVVGDKSRFALTCEIDVHDFSQGCIYIYVMGKKFGNNASTYELDFFLWHAVGEFSDSEFDYPLFFPLTGFEVVSAIDQLYSDSPVYGLCAFERLAPGFIKAFEDDDERSFRGFSAEEIIENILQRGGNYGFNFLTIVLLSNGRKAKLFVGEKGLPNEKPKFYEGPDKYCGSVELDLGEFLATFESLYKRYHDEYPEYAKRYD